MLAHQPLLVNGLEQAFTEVKEFLASFSGRQVVMPSSRPVRLSQAARAVHRLPAGYEWDHCGHLPLAKQTNLSHFWTAKRMPAGKRLGPGSAI